MPSVIVGTAGHIDHGKTALVKALTGIDADRLAEEKRRGITIDIGFAHLDLPAPGGEILRLGFVDVPGHERFVRNMLAGVGGIDLVLLVIAADESIKPQTREHFDICRLLAIRRGIAVLTKSDLVDSDTLDVVRLEVEELLRGSFLAPPSPVLPVSSLTGAGIEELKRTLAQVASQVRPKDSNAIPRLPVDRVFTVKGFGTVLTGTLISGAIRKEDELESFPLGRRVRVRGIQVHGQSSELALAGQRTALNLAGVSVDDLARGAMLAPPDTFTPASTIDVQISLLPGSRPLKNRARAHFHAYTAQTIATLRLFGAEPGRTASKLAPGETGFARLKLARPLLLLPGDRFILRQFSPVVTIGGGVVLDAHPTRLILDGDFAPESFLPLMLSGAPEDALHRRIARRASHGLTTQQLVAETGWAPNRLGRFLKILVEAKRVSSVGGVFMDRIHFESLKAALPAQVEADIAKHHLEGGIGKSQLRARLPGAVLDGLLSVLLREGKLELHGDQVRLPGRGVVMEDDEAESRKTIEEAFAASGLKVPALRDVLAGLKIDEVRAHKIVTLLLRDRILVKISQDLVFHRDALAALRARLAAEKARSPKMDVARFKDLTGVSRKYAIPLLEYLDREHVTRRLGDERLIL